MSIKLIFILKFIYHPLHQKKNNNSFFITSYTKEIFRFLTNTSNGLDYGFSGSYCAIVYEKHTISAIIKWIAGPLVRMILEINKFRNILFIH